MPEPEFVDELGEVTPEMLENLQHLDIQEYGQPRFAVIQTKPGPICPWCAVDTEASPRWHDGKRWRHGELLNCRV